MNQENLMKAVAHFVETSPYNYVQKEAAISEKVIGMKMYEEPLFGFADVNDTIFLEFKKPEVIGNHFSLPKEWLTEAKTVISFFLPFTEEVKKGNEAIAHWPSAEWLHGRIEGQLFINELCLFIKAQLTDAGYHSVIPSQEPAFWSKGPADGQQPFPQAAFTSNWSERHIAYAAGLGTFGLSKGLITAKGVAGRFGSLVTDAALAPTPRTYSTPYEHCIICGACIPKCPAQAISLATGKNHTICKTFLNQTAEKYKPRYGCGKCQIGVPCESRNPRK